jgi:hypothetical protein
MRSRSISGDAPCSTRRRASGRGGRASTLRCVGIQLLAGALGLLGALPCVRAVGDVVLGLGELRVLARGCAGGAPVEAAQCGAVQLQADGVSTAVRTLALYPPTAPPSVMELERTNPANEWAVRPRPTPHPRHLHSGAK